MRLFSTLKRLLIVKHGLDGDSLTFLNSPEEHVLGQLCSPFGTVLSTIYSPEPKLFTPL